MRISLIVAVASNSVIGSNNTLPWHLSDDLKRFKALTMGHPIIMGRKTFDSIGRALPGRTSIVITRRHDAPLADGVLRATSFDEAIALARTAPGSDEAFVIGGGEVYALALPHAHHLHLTRVHAEVTGDTLFPPIDMREWREMHHESISAGGKNDHAHEYVLLERIHKHLDKRHWPEAA